MIDDRGANDDQQENQDGRYPEQAIYESKGQGDEAECLHEQQGDIKEEEEGEEVLHGFGVLRSCWMRRMSCRICAAMRLPCRIKLIWLVMVLWVRLSAPAMKTMG